MARIIQAFAQFFDESGSPLVNGWIEFFESGSNNTHKDTYYDSIYQIRNENPLQLDGSGRCPPVFGQGNYRAVLYKQNLEDETDTGDQVQVQDPVPNLSDGVGAGGGEGFQPWDSAETYQIGDIVNVSGTYYRSLITDNINNNPPLEPFAWEQIEFLSIWNDTISYNIGDLVRHDYELYFSKVSLNLNNPPDSTPSSWRRLDSDIIGTDGKTDDYEILPTDRDKLIVLGNTTLADKTFTLPAVTASENGFRVWIYNDSDYDLTIDSLLAIPIWIDSTGEIILEKGTFIELRYSSSLNRWLPKGNMGPILGGQDLGTDTLPVKYAYIDTLDIVTSISLPSDIPIYFGDSNEGSILYNSLESALQIVCSSALEIDSTGSLSLSSPAGVNVSSDLDITLSAGQTINSVFLDHLYVFRDTALFWDFQDNGNIVPGAPNPNPNLGSVTNPLKYIYVGNSGRIYLDDSNILYFGTGQDLGIMHDGSHSYIDNTTGSIYFRTGNPLVNSLILYSSRNANFLGEVLFGDQVNIGTGGYLAESSGLMVSSLGANSLYLGTNSVSRWEISSSGTLYSSYGIGSNTNRIGSLYSTYVNASNIRAISVVECDTIASWAPVSSLNNLNIGLHYGSTFEKTMALTDFREFGGNFIITFLFNGTYYDLTIPP